MKTSRLFGVLVGFALGLCSTSSVFADDLFVAFWNVENLFDLDDDTEVEGDEEFTAAGPKNWTAERLEIKLSNLARVIQDMNDKQGPDVLGLCEIENRAVIELLIKQLKLPRDYAIVHQDSPSGRGIDCAVVYDKKVVNLKSSQFHKIEGETTRDIVEAQLEVTGGAGAAAKADFHLFANHWPSRLSPEPERVKVAAVLRKRIDEILAKDNHADVVVIGDLNDYPNNNSVAETLNATGDIKAVRVGAAKLYSAMWPIHEDPDAGTYVFENKWGVLDHVILSAGLLDAKGLSYVPRSATTIFQAYQVFRPKTGIARPSRSFSGNLFHANGYSDHVPVSAKFKILASE